MKTNMEEKTQMIAVPLSLHSRLKELKQNNREPFYSVIARLMDNTPKIEQKEATSDGSA